MSRRGYPRVDSRSQIRAHSSTARCQATNCQDPAVWSVEVQFSWFRSDDNTVTCCAAHCTIRSVSEPEEVRKFVAQFPREVWT